MQTDNPMSIPGQLSADDFLQVVQHTPLVSIDLLVPDEQGRFLLGCRVNRPAQGYWFVPGGRILKNETLDNAFARLCRVELGMTLSRSTATFQGVYEHFYEDCFAGDTASTHYVVLAYRLPPLNGLTLPTEQHDRYQWLAPEQIVFNSRVHPNSQAYFLM